MNRDSLADVVLSSSYPRDDEGPLPTARSRSYSAPLTFTQQWLWNSLEFNHRPGMRMVSVSRRLSGQLNVESLRLSFLELVRRHAALRTRIVMADGHLMQHIEETGQFELDIIDLTELQKDARETLAQKLAQQFIYKPTLVLSEPLFAAKLMALGERDHLLVVAMDHLISDAVSAAIFLRELFAVYAAFSRGLPHGLPDVPVQFPDYAASLFRSQQTWTEEHGGYWNERLAGARQLQPFTKSPSAHDGGATWRLAPIRFDKQLSDGLRNLSLRARTTPALAALTTYVALLLRWSDQSDCVVPFMTTGRPRPELKAAIGFFSALMFVRISLENNDTFLDLLRRTSQEYNAARKHADCGRIVAQQPAPEFSWNPAFNWLRADLFQDTGSGGQPEHENFLTTTTYRVDVTMRDGMEWKYDFAVRLRDSVDGIVGVVVFRADRVAMHTVERFNRNFVLFAETLVREPDHRVALLSCAP